MDIKPLNIKTSTIVLPAIGIILALIVIFGSVYTVNEGHIGIVKRFSEAKEQVNPGLHFKVPFIDSVEEIEVRTGNAILYTQVIQTDCLFLVITETHMRPYK